MNAKATTTERIEAAIRALGTGPLAESALQRHVAPLFSRHKLAYGDRIYLANHSLGRPLDATDDDVREGLSLWYANLGGAWDGWLAEMAAYRARVARLLSAAGGECIVPKANAGQGLRAVLNTYDTVPRVVATRGEFDSLDLILREYAARGRIAPPGEMVGRIVSAESGCPSRPLLDQPSGRAGRSSMQCLRRGH